MRIGVDPTTQNGINRIDGFVKYVSYIEKEALPNLRKEWDALLNKGGLVASFATIEDSDEPRTIDYFVDETDMEHNGKQFLALSFVQTEETAQIDVSTQATLREHIADPFADGCIEDLEKRKLHFTDATQDLRKAYVEKLSILPFRAYVVFGELKEPNEYGNLYLELINKILPHRLMGADQANVRVVFEENSKIKKLDLSSAINDLQTTLKSTNNRRPTSIEIIVGSKPDYSCFSMPDFLLAIFSGYARSNEKPDPRRVLFFEKLRDRYELWPNLVFEHLS